MSTNAQRKICFVISPIGAPGTEVRKRSELVLELVIRPAAKKRGYSVKHAIDMPARDFVTSQVVREILEAPLVIADLSGNNPNVMYQLALRHSARRPVILISTEHNIPFDLAAMRTIVFDANNVDSLNSAAGELVEAITQVESQTTFESPVSIAADLQSFEKLQEEDERISKKPSRSIYRVLKDIESRLKALEYGVNVINKSSNSTKEYSRRIFIIHGHDGELKNELARLLERLDFEPVILHEQPDQGQTIFSKLNGQMSDVGFAFVILTPDDMGGSSSDPGNARPRARQNVIFEHGLFAGYLRPERVCAIRRGDVEIPSDLHGILYKDMSVGSSLRSVALELVAELRAAGYIVDANKL